MYYIYTYSVLSVSGRHALCIAYAAHIGCAYSPLSDTLAQNIQLSNGPLSLAFPPNAAPPFWAAGDDDDACTADVVPRLGAASSSALAPPGCWAHTDACTADAVPRCRGARCILRLSGSPHRRQDRQTGICLPASTRGIWIALSPPGRTSRSRCR